MNRYLVFAGDVYYPDGGMHDFHSSYEDKDAAVVEAKSIVEVDSSKWAHVYDTQVSDYVWRSLRDGY